MHKRRSTAKNKRARPFVSLRAAILQALNDRGETLEDLRRRLDAGAYFSRMLRGSPGISLAERCMLELGICIVVPAARERKRAPR